YRTSGQSFACRRLFTIFDVCFLRQSLPTIEEYVRNSTPQLRDFSHLNCYPDVSDSGKNLKLDRKVPWSETLQKPRKSLLIGELRAPFQKGSGLAEWEDARTNSQAGQLPDSFHPIGSRG